MAVNRGSAMNPNGAATARSPLSASPPVKIRDLPKSFLLDQLAGQYETRPPEHIVETDYTLWQCSETGLQFAWPMLPGSPAFYNWVGSFDSYYPGGRWEYEEVRRLLQGRQSPGREFKVLDAGCGKGDFLRRLDIIPNECKYALDFNEPAVELCRRQGFNAFCGTIEAAIAARVFPAGEFSAVTSFHCLEHVSQPVEFTRTLLDSARPGGSVFVSTPYSPMSTETDGFDILNHPPHHLTRWNLDAYKKLAEILGVKMRYFVPPGGATKRALKSFWISRHGPKYPVNRAHLIAELSLHLPQFLTHYQKQLQRQRAHHGIGADVIMVELTRP